MADSTACFEQVGHAYLQAESSSSGRLDDATITSQVSRHTDPISDRPCNEQTVQSSLCLLRLLDL